MKVSSAVIDGIRTREEKSRCLAAGLGNVLAAHCLTCQELGNVRRSSTRHMNEIVLYGICWRHCLRDVGSVQSIRDYGNSLLECEVEVSMGERTVPALSEFACMNGDLKRSSIETTSQKAEEFTIRSNLEIYEITQNQADRLALCLAKRVEPYAQ